MTETMQGFSFSKLLQEFLILVITNHFNHLITLASARYLRVVKIDFSILV